MIDYVISTILHSELSFLLYGFLVVTFGGYFFLAGGTYLYFYVLKKDAWKRDKIQKEIPSGLRIWHEIKWSLSSTVIWIFFAIWIIVGIDQNWFKLYFDISEYGRPYFILSIVLLVLMHDTYFYWVHRFMHSSYAIYKLFHKTHHDSTNPTPFAMHSFAPLEAVALALFVPIVLYVLPIHLAALMSWFVIEAVVNAIGHLGYELFPLRFFKTRYGKWFNPPTHHNLHHQESRSGFSHYFNFWDRVMGTNHANYNEILQ